MFYNILCWFLPYINMISQRHSYYFTGKVTLCLIQRPIVWSNLYEVAVLSSVKFTNDYRRCEARAMIYSAAISGGPDSFHSVPWAEGGGWDPAGHTQSEDRRPATHSYWALKHGKSEVRCTVNVRPQISKITMKKVK